MDNIGKILIGAAVVGVGFLVVRSVIGGAVEQAIKVGPGGLGRAYGPVPKVVSTNLAFWPSSSVKFGCVDGTVWIAEGAGFLPPIDSPAQPTEDLGDGSAWGFVEHLIRQSIDTNPEIDEIDEAVAYLIGVTAGRSGLGSVDCPDQQPGSPLHDWGQDVRDRVRAYAATRLPGA